ncbi:MAG TPA: Fe-S cluster assembly protein SufD [Vicinamibacterales bacterium]|nr:Fe-S cluster assembly protein SufD [Vicinamibacterales bacterium]
MPQVAEKLQPWITALEARRDGGPRWLEDLRARGAERFATLGFPTTRDEEWRFTSVAPIAATEFVPAPERRLTESALEGYLYSEAAHRVVVVNGRFSPELSRTGGLPAGVRIGSLGSAIAEQADEVARYFGRLATFNTRAFVALNTAFAHDGACVFVPPGVVVDEPVQLLFVSDAGGDGPVVAHPRVLVVASERTQIRIAETYVGVPGQVYLTNAVSEIFLGEHAVLDHYKVQEESVQAFHIGSLDAHLSRSSTFSSHSFALGARIVRNDANAILDGEGAECTLNGLYLADGDRLVDNHTMIDHAKAHCPSHEVYKGILGGRARAVFNGKIVVRQDAQKTNAKQTNRALLLSDNASINTKPQLEIFADDVKCTHGAAIGQIDEDALFYLRARGLTFFEARDLLIHAFAGEILDRVQIEPLRHALEQELYAQLARDLAEADAA